MGRDTNKYIPEEVVLPANSRIMEIACKHCPHRRWADVDLG
jgi:hypothetical protein